jgi:hypothetical protein
MSQSELSKSEQGFAIVNSLRSKPGLRTRGYPLTGSPFERLEACRNFGSQIAAFGLHEPCTEDCDGIF